MRQTKEILNEIGQFEPKDGDWLKLDDLLEELWTTGKADEGLKTMLGVFEKFPEDDGAGVFWSIVHGIESFDSYELELIDSIRRQPSKLGLIMIYRIENSGQKSIAEQEIKSVYREMLSHLKLPKSLKEDLNKYINEK